MIATVYEIRVFECDMQKFVLTISLDVEPAEFGMNFDAHKVNPNVTKGYPWTNYFLLMTKKASDGPLFAP
jgi:hypothetical protein